jgi:4-diphosphocytidyl-2C-methyl-D-erythritol kinase
MSGSGPTVFALYADEATALAGKEQAIATLHDSDVDFWAAPLIADGIRLV